ncbi:Rapamycin-insensitive companion of mTOR-like isoform X1 [Oopsacas minuta]|uniref:Rapamycin-insensitive companion of mTOR-like isoform X1 n=1 Tax=Oopsacas minuta TaxID=111878 RepID=A0AAV7KC08_9METZ|nr:Rapamycin-insensitive companion of mTOR-like isoform X1 [Oopsacas minuta]
MTSKFANYHKKNLHGDDTSSPIPLRFPSSSRLLRKKTHQMQKKTRSLRETLAQLIEVHKTGPPLSQGLTESESLNVGGLKNDSPSFLHVDTPPNDISPLDGVQEYVKSHTHLLESISYLLRLRSGPSASKQSPVTFEASIEDLVQAIRLSICSEWAVVRASALQCLRVLLRTPGVEQETYRQIMNLGVDVLITRSLDTGILEGGYDMELVQALRLLYLFVQKHTSEISRPLLAVLVSIASSATVDNKLFRTCLAMLGLLAAKQPQLLQETGGIRALVQGVLTCSDMHMNESLISAVISLLSHPSTRLVVNLLHELQPLLAPFTDPHYIPHFFEISRKEIQSPADLERAHEQARIQAVNACASAFTSLFLSWSGFFALTHDFDSSSLRFLEVLPLVTPLQQHAMLDALFRILLIAPPASSSINQLFDSLPSNGSDRRTRSLVSPFSQGLASLSEDWVTYESERTMPSVCKSRTDLALCYRVLIMSILIDNQVLVRLLETSTRSPEPVIVKAVILAKEILLTLHKLFPFGLDIAELTDSSITNFLNSEARRSQSWKASKIDVLLQRLYVLERDSNEEKYSRFLLLLVKPPKLNLLSSLVANKTEDLGMLNCIDDISESISLAGSLNNYATWNWAKINSLLATIQPTNAVVQKLKDSQLIRRILEFYLPSSQLFYKLPLKADFDHYVQGGLNLITFLLSSACGSQLFPLLHEILDKLRLFLDEEQNKNNILKEHSMASSLAQAYFLFLGHIAHLDWKILVEFGYLGLILELFVCRPPNKTLIKLLLPTLVFYGTSASLSFSLLQVAALSNECQDTRVFCIKFLRTLLRCQKNNFSSQGIHLLVLLAYDESSIVREEAIKVCVQFSFFPGFICSHVDQQ